jgi:alpha-amylase
LGQDSNHRGIAALVRVHEKYAGGSTGILYVDDDLYVMQRDGNETQRGLVLVLNNRSNWNGTWVQTRWTDTRLSPHAWWSSNDDGIPEDKWTNVSGWTELWAPPRGYAVYIPQ